MRGVGCAIAVLSVVLGAGGVSESIHHWRADDLQTYLGLAVVGGMIGLTVFAVGMLQEK
jgi:hypothetical protein